MTATLDYPVSNFSLFEEIANYRQALTVAELARIMNCTSRTIYNLIEAKVLPALQIGSMLRLDPKTTAAWLKGRSTVR